MPIIEKLGESTKKGIKKTKEYKLEVLQKMSDLATAGFGLVAALAWNDAIKGAFDKFLPKGSGLLAQFLYAILVTVLIVVITMQLGKLVNLAKNKEEK
ncbi:MAG: DUF5654 family protein [Patescibacteria group bacterium]|jgi:hypothetical protein